MVEGFVKELLEYCQQIMWVPPQLSFGHTVVFPVPEILMEVFCGQLGLGRWGDCSAEFLISMWSGQVIKVHLSWIGKSIEEYEVWLAFQLFRL